MPIAPRFTLFHEKLSILTSMNIVTISIMTKKMSKNTPMYRFLCITLAGLVFDKNVKRENFSAKETYIPILKYKTEKIHVKIVWKCWFLKTENTGSKISLRRSSNFCVSLQFSWWSKSRTNNKNHFRYANTVFL